MKLQRNQYGRRYEEICGIERYRMAPGSPLSIAYGTRRNSELSYLIGLFTLRKPKINTAKRDMKHVSIAGSVTGISLRPSLSTASNFQTHLTPLQHVDIASDKIDTSSQTPQLYCRLFNQGQRCARVNDGASLVLELNTILFGIGAYLARIHAKII